MSEDFEHGLGRHKDPVDDRDHLWRAVAIEAAQPVPVRYRIGASGPVLDQGQTPECVAFTSTSVLLHQEFTEHKHYYQFDPHWLYAECKKIDGIPGDGTVYRAALQVMQKQGLLAHMSGTTTRMFTIANYARLATVQEIKEAVLYANGVVAYGSDIDSNWYKCPPSGILGKPNDQIIGGHEVSVEGWDDTIAGGALLIKNSWGLGWGYDGYCWLPYSHLAAYPDFDLWKTIDESSPVLP